MFGFGRKKIAIAEVIAVFVEQSVSGLRARLPEIRAAIDASGDGAGSLSDDQLFFELFPATLAIGIQPVRNLWDANTFERAKRELVTFLEGAGQAELSLFVKRRLDEYLSAWSSADPTKGGNLPWDEVTGGVLANLGVARSTLNGVRVISPISILGVSSIISSLPGLFWKNLQKTHKLV